MCFPALSEPGVPRSLSRFERETRFTLASHRPVLFFAALPEPATLEEGRVWRRAWDLGSKNGHPPTPPPHPKSTTRAQGFYF
eukprot:scaffold1446_cov127-Isochrysis_galbana.AAC.2